MSNLLLKYDIKQLAVRKILRFKNLFAFQNEAA